MCAKNYENWLAVDKVIAEIIRLTVFWPTLYNIPWHNRALGKIRSSKQIFRQN